MTILAVLLVLVIFSAPLSVADAPVLPCNNRQVTSCIRLYGAWRVGRGMDALSELNGCPAHERGLPRFLPELDDFLGGVSAANRETTLGKILREATEIHQCNDRSLAPSLKLCVQKNDIDQVSYRVRGGDSDLAACLDDLLERFVESTEELGIQPSEALSDLDPGVLEHLGSLLSENVRISIRNQTPTATVQLRYPNSTSVAEWQPGPGGSQRVPLETTIEVTDACQLSVRDGVSHIKIPVAEIPRDPNGVAVVDIEKLYEPAMVLNIESNGPDQPGTIEFPGAPSPVSVADFLGEEGSIVCYDGFFPEFFKARDAEGERSGDFEVTLFGDSLLFPKESGLKATAIRQGDSNLWTLRLGRGDVWLYIREGSDMEMAEKVRRELIAGVGEGGLQILSPLPMESIEAARKHLATQDAELGLYGISEGPTAMDWQFIHDAIPPSNSPSFSRIFETVSRASLDRLEGVAEMARLLSEAPPLVTTRVLPFEFLDVGTDHPEVSRRLDGCPEQIQQWMPILKANGRLIASARELDAVVAGSNGAIRLSIAGESNSDLVELEVPVESSPVILDASRVNNKWPISLLLFQLQRLSEDKTVSPVRRYAARLNHHYLLQLYHDPQRPPHGLANDSRKLTGKGEYSCQDQELGCGLIDYHSALLRSVLKGDKIEGVPPQSRTDRADGPVLDSRLKARQIDLN